MAGFDSTADTEALYAWLQDQSRPRSAERILAFLDSMPAERSGIRPTGYEYREYKNWRGIPKPRRCPFCNKVKGEIRKVRGGVQGICPNCRATGPKTENHDEALRAWNGKGVRSLVALERARQIAEQFIEEFGGLEGG